MESLAVLFQSRKLCVIQFVKLAVYARHHLQPTNSCVPLLLTVPNREGRQIN